MGWFFPKIEIKNKIDVARTLRVDENNVTKCILLLNVTNNNNEICYTAITNNWMTLNKDGFLKCVII